MNRAEQTTAITALLLILITTTAVHIHQTDPQTQKNIQLFNIRQTLRSPNTAEFLGIKQYDLLDHSITVYTWRQENTLYEAQLDEQGSIIQATTYQHNTNETQIIMTPALAETLAQQKLITETQYPPGHPNLSEPTFEYHTYRPEGHTWTVEWGLHVGNYTISNTHFEVIVITETGKTKTLYNSFNEVPEIPDYAPPTITSGEAINIAVEEYKRIREYAIIDSTKINIEISSPRGFLDKLPPLTLVWLIHVEGIGIRDGNPVRNNPTYYIDAYSGEVYFGFSIGWGWDEINWTRSRYPYYGLEYPITIHNYPYEYQFPATIEEAKNHIYNITQNRILDNYAWESLILTLDQEIPKIAYFWTRAYDGIKTGTLAPIDSLNLIQRHSQILDSYLVVIDAQTGQLIKAEELNNIGAPANTLNITRDQAINITATSPITDPRNKIIAPENLRRAEPRIIKPDWISQLTYTGDYSHLYIAEGNQSEPRIYWLIEYVSYPEVHGGYTGTYLVDAETGQLALALEDKPLPDLMFRGNAPEHITLRRGETTTFNITVTAAPTLEAQLPVTLTADRIPEGVTATIHGDKHQLSNQKPAVFKITLTASTDAPIGSYDTGFSIQLLGTRTSAYTELEITP